MKKLKQLFFVPFAVFCLLSLSGCAGQGLQLVRLLQVGPGEDTHTSDSFLTTVRLETPVTGDAFTEDMKAVARGKGYQIAGMHGHGATERSVMIMKQSPTGWNWQYTVTLNLEGDGRDVQINASTSGNNHKADPGTAKVIGDEFKTAIIAYYSPK